MTSLLVLHGPNLNMLGRREPAHYGAVGLDEIDSRLKELADAAGHGLECFQSNAEHQLVARIHQAAEEAVAFMVFNPAAFTHTSIALRDAVLAVEIPFIEVHLSNVYRRDAFRHKSYFSDIAIGVISGFGAKGYELALEAAMSRIQGPQSR